MQSRRSFVATIPVAAALATTGCLGFVTGSEALSFEASGAMPSQEALDETGYEERESEWRGIEETVEAAGVERDIEAQFWIGAFTKDVAVQGDSIEAAAFALASMPKMEVAGSSYNPVSDMDNREIVDEVQSNYDSNMADVRDLRHEETREVSILGSDRDVDVFTATADVEGTAVDVLLHVAVVGDGDDLVLLVGGHPEQLPDEEINVEILMESVEHPPSREIEPPGGSGNSSDDGTGGSEG